ncbi:MAG: DUF2809 domain-containing protein [Myxococcales bacterium]
MKLPTLPRLAPWRSRLGLALAILLLEIHIALHWHDAWVRPFGGDTLAVAFLHMLARGLWPLPVRGTALGSFALACGVEFAQYLHVVDRLGLAQHRLARTVIGTSFHPGDLVAYALGALLAVGCEHWLDRRALRLGARAREPGNVARTSARGANPRLLR